MTIATAPLGVSGYTFADLHEPERLASLYDRFCEHASAADPALWAEWDAYRRAPDAPRPPVALSNLLIAMAPHVSAFVTRLFACDVPASAITAATQAQDDLFRFKVDFVRRRALPLLKNGAHVAATPEDDAIVEALIAGASAQDRELAIARAGCALLDDEKTQSAIKSAIRNPQSAIRGAAPLVRRAHPRSRLSRLGDLPLPGERRALSPGRGRASGSAAARGADRPGLAAAAARWLHPDRRADAAARDPQRDPLLRAVPRARQGFLLEGIARQGRHGQRQPARHQPRRLSARREDLGDAHAAQGRRCGRRAGARDRRQPDVPRHRTPDLQRLHEVVHLPEAGAGQHPADRDRRADRRARHAVRRRDLRPADTLESAQRAPAVRAARTTARTCWSSASARPATRCRTTW